MIHLMRHLGAIEGLIQRNSHISLIFETKLDSIFTNQQFEIKG